ncbi:MAG: ABC transporter ATP-binding protein, partial [Thermodesulfobacteriota bacterium]|nr:ABC transporter ATP-binding protein [Thermodesulfobacteriota bacterium]
IDNVSMKFGDVVAVDSISLSIPRGTICGFVGSDGAGKTTLLRMVATMIRPDSGAICIDGIDVARSRARAKTIIGYMPQRFGLYEDLTVEENIDFFMDIFGIHHDERERRKRRFLGFSNLLPFVDRLAGNLSGGMKQKLGLACVLVHQPRVLVLDEPTNGVDPVSRQEFWDILFQMRREEGVTILISTAYLDEGEKCDCLALMHRSKLLDSGTPEGVRGPFPDLEEAMIHRIQQADEELIHDNFKL